MLKSQNIHTFAGHRLFPSLATGVLLAASFPPYPLPFVSCLALAPLLRSWRFAADARRLYTDAYLAFQLTFILSFSWPAFHALPATGLASTTGIVLIPMTMAAPFALSLPVRKQLGKAGGYVFLISLYLLVEAFWLHGPVSMPSALLGHSLAAWPSLNQFADIAGVAGLSLWILLLNVLVTEAWLEPSSRWYTLGATFLLIVLAAGYSRLRLIQYQHHGDESIRILAVQPGTTAIIWTNPDDHERLVELLEFSDSLLTATRDAVSMIVWPETAIPLAGSDSAESKNWQMLREWTAERNVALLAGSITRSRLSDDPSVAYANSALFFAPGASPEKYDKNILVPFAERVPFESLYESLSELRVDAGGVAGYQPGQTQPQFTLGDTSFGVVICFESLFGHFMREYVRNGTGFVVAISNIGWWGPSFAPSHYIGFSSLRAVEFRRPLLINTVAGPTVLVHPDGGVEQMAYWMEKRGVVLTLPHETTLTMYARYGDWLFLVAIALAAGLGAWALKQKRR